MTIIESTTSDLLLKKLGIEKSATCDIILLGNRGEGVLAYR